MARGSFREASKRYKGKTKEAVQDFLDLVRARKYYRQMRNNLANKLNDESIKTIKLYDFRHFFATMLYAKTKDIL